uniref:Uncharacterized protein n=1 Tax=Syphacia muris TaxID=451379 RepID=A0A0N5ANB9_9BILA
MEIEDGGEGERLKMDTAEWDGWMDVVQCRNDRFNCDWCQRRLYDDDKLNETVQKQRVDSSSSSFLDASSTSS